MKNEGTISIYGDAGILQESLLNQISHRKIDIKPFQRDIDSSQINPADIIIIVYNPDFHKEICKISQYSLVCKLILLTKNRKYPDLPKYNIKHISMPLSFYDLLQFINKCSDVIKISTGMFLNIYIRSLVLTTKSTCDAINITNKEYDLIKYLVDNKDIPNNLSKEQVLYKVFGYKNTAETNTIETHIYRLKNKIGDGRKFIEYLDNKYKLI